MEDLTKLRSNPEELSDETIEKFEGALDSCYAHYLKHGQATVDALEDNTQELAFAKGFREGYICGDKLSECPAKDLSELIDHLNKRYPEVSFAKLCRIVTAVDKWEKNQSKDIIGA